MRTEVNPVVSGIKGVIPIDSLFIAVTTGPKFEHLFSAVCPLMTVLTIDCAVFTTLFLPFDPLRMHSDSTPALVHGFKMHSCIWACGHIGVTTPRVVWFPDPSSEGEREGLVNYLQLARIHGISIPWTWPSEPEHDWSVTAPNFKILIFYRIF